MYIQVLEEKKVICSIQGDGLTAIVGKTNSGKTEFLRALCSMPAREKDKHKTFRYHFISEFSSGEKQIKAVFISSSVALLPMTVEKNLHYGMEVNFEAELSHEAKAARIAKACTLAGLSESYIANNNKKIPHHLPLLEQKKIVLARSLVVEPYFLGIDEPLEGLDTNEITQFEDILLHLKKEMPIVLATHNPTLALRLADKVIFMEDGSIVEFGNAREVLLEPKTAAAKEYFNPLWERYELLNQLDKKTLQLQETNAALQQQIKEKDGIVQVVSHDIRSPLSSIMGIAEMLEQGLEAEDVTIVREYGRTIKDTCASLMSLVTDILEMYALEHGKLRVHLDRFEAREAVLEAVDMLTMMALQKKITLQPCFPEEEVWIYSDRSKLVQICVNIISNAIKFSHEGGKILILFDKQSDALQLSVQDFGKGMTQKQKEALFKKFEMRSTGTAGEPGSGLGMYIVKQILDVLDGRIDVVSEIDYGTTMKITLPLDEPEEQNLEEFLR